MINTQKVSKGITFHSIYKEEECERITKEFHEKFDERFKTLTSKEKSYSVKFLEKVVFYSYKESLVLLNLPKCVQSQ